MIESTVAHICNEHRCSNEAGLLTLITHLHRCARMVLPHIPNLHTCLVSGTQIDLDPLNFSKIHNQVLWKNLFFKNIDKEEAFVGPVELWSRTRNELSRNILGNLCSSYNICTASEETFVLEKNTLWRNNLLLAHNAPDFASETEKFIVADHFPLAMFNQSVETLLIERYSSGWNPVSEVYLRENGLVGAVYYALLAFKEWGTRYVKQLDVDPFCGPSIKGDRKNMRWVEKVQADNVVTANKVYDLQYDALEAFKAKSDQALLQTAQDLVDQLGILNDPQSAKALIDYCKKKGILSKRELVLNFLRYREEDLPESRVAKVLEKAGAVLTNQENDVLPWTEFEVRGKKFIKFG